MIYVFDTNTFSEMSPYFPDIFRAFWSTFENAVAGGEVTSTREVFRELKNGPQNHVFEWCGRNPSVFPVSDARETAFVTKIFAIPQFSQLIGEKQTLRGTPVADPFIIARAAVLEPDSKAYARARRLMANWMAAKVMKAASVSARFS
jgi:Domain of unknown function (DUF4411)